MMAGLWPTTIWVWDGRSLLTGEAGAIFAAQMAALPGEKGVIIKAADGEYTNGPYGPWRLDVVQRLRDVGVGVGLWTFNYGRGPATYGQKVERHIVAAELAALERALAAAEPEAVILNIEDQVMGSPDPAADVAALVSGARALVGAVGVSTVWHWADSMGWPFAAAVGAEVDYWSNQVYSTTWRSYTDYRALYDRLAGGRPDYISLWANGQPSAGTTISGAEMDQMGRWAQAMGAPGVAWWSAQHLRADQWRGVQSVASLYGAPTVPLPGAGILAAMTARGDRPLGPERYLKDDQGQDVMSMAAGQQGRYTYDPDSRRVTFTAYEP